MTIGGELGGGFSSFDEKAMTDLAMEHAMAEKIAEKAGELDVSNPGETKSQNSFGSETDSGSGFSPQETHAISHGSFSGSSSASIIFGFSSYDTIDKWGGSENTDQNSLYLFWLKYGNSAGIVSGSLILHPKGLLPPSG